MRATLLIILSLGISLPHLQSQSVRVTSALLVSGSGSNYNNEEGIRILQGIKPDVVLIQQFVYTTNTYANFTTSVLGSGAEFFRGSGTIPTGILSRYPIVLRGEWTDPTQTNRTFSWAKIDIPGDKFLWAVSVHFATVLASRNAEAIELVSKIRANIPDNDYLVIGGNFNCENRSEAIFTTLSAVISIPANFPVDQASNGNTNLNRTKPYDNLLFDADLQAASTPTVIGANSFSGGLILDTRSYTPLSEFAPALVTDSSAHSHLAVTRDFSSPMPIRITATNFSLTPFPLGQITFTSQIGQTYQVEASSLLSPGSWQELGVINAASGTFTTFQVVPSNPAPGQIVDSQLGTAVRRFYRIVR